MKNIFLILSLPIFFAPGYVSAQTCKDSILPRITEAQFIDHGDGTVSDAKTGLMWTVCTAGQVYSSDGCSGSSETYQWGDGLQYVAALNAAGGFAGRADWRMPSINELSSIVDRRCFAPSITLSVFPDTPSSAYWSSTPSLTDNLGVSIDFSTGSDLVPEVVTDRHVRLVRDVQ
tara:strand:- start:83 stop:604 length:522 start_codon:yes stop_codon:yes gene_type:complete